MKVVTPEEMRRLEGEAVQQGLSLEMQMEAAGRSVAEAARHCIRTWQLEPQVALLVGCGNNGGDAYAAGLALLREGHPVVAYAMQGRAHSFLNQLYERRFREQGGLVRPAAEMRATPRQLWIDGILGTGFSGKLDKPLLDWMGAINAMHGLVVSIDLPSGINGSTGEGADASIRATHTVTLGLPKLGLFIHGAWASVGALQVGDLGWKQESLQAAREVAEWPQPAGMAALLPPLPRCRHKYQAGLVVGMGGSLERPGAAKLSSLAALRGGAGLMHLFYPKQAQEEMRDLPFEVMKEVWTEKRFQEELGRAAACFVGPGLGRTRPMQKWLMRYLPTLTLPSVIDADALYFIRDLDTLPKHAILTPHRGELGRFVSYKESDFIASATQFAVKHHVTLLVKGAPTFVFGAHHVPHIVTAGDPGMATAGAGDVLTGLIAALLAQGMRPFPAGLLGAYVHGRAGEKVAAAHSSYSLMATDLIAEFGAVFRELLQSPPRW